MDRNRIWAVEAYRKDLDQAKGASPFYIVDKLIAQIRRSSLFICVLRDVYGTSVFGEAESVSFLETEIYQAALFHNNIRFFLMEPFNPPAKLAGLLELVKTVRPGIVPERALPHDAVLDQIRRTIETAGKPRRSLTYGVRSFVTELERRRGHAKSDIEFLGKVFRPVTAKPDLDHIRFLLDGLAGEQSIEKRLTRTWIALRELCAAPYTGNQMEEIGEGPFRLFFPSGQCSVSLFSGYGLNVHVGAYRYGRTSSMRFFLCPLTILIGIGKVALWIDAV